MQCRRFSRLDVLLYYDIVGTASARDVKEREEVLRGARDAQDAGGAGEGEAYTHLQTPGRRDNL